MNTKTLDLFPKHTFITEIDGFWYAYGRTQYDREHNLMKIVTIGRDCPKGGFLNHRSVNQADWTKEGIKSIISPSATKVKAIEKAKRGGVYQGEKEFR